MTQEDVASYKPLLSVLVVLRDWVLGFIPDPLAVMINGRKTISGRGTWRVRPSWCSAN